MYHEPEGYELLNDQYNSIFKAQSLDEVKEKAEELWPNCIVDGDFNLGAKTLYIFDKDDNEIGYIEQY